MQRETRSRLLRPRTPAWQGHRKNPEGTGEREALAREVCAELRNYRKLGPFFAGYEDDVLSLIHI